MKRTKLRELILPNQKINFFVITILILGVISGSIFLMMSSKTDQQSVIQQIQSFFLNLSKNQVDVGLAFRNSLIINYLFVGMIWIFGLSMIGVLLNIFLTYIKGFLVGFSVSAMFLTYRYKGILPAILYLFPSQFLNICIVVVLSIYSLMFARNLLGIVVSKKNRSNRLMMKKYVVILMFCIIGSFVSSLFEVYLFPTVLKWVISFYV